MTKPIFIVGDIHGKWDDLFMQIRLNDIRDCVLIGVGDLGAGFKLDRQQMRQFEYVNNFFQSRNIDFSGIRGNHDDPAYFDGKVDMSNFKLIPDYTYMTLNDKRFGFVGGAISIDRRMRKEGISYWKKEPFILNVSKVERCDILVTHSAPTWSGPCDKSGISHWCDKDQTLWDECLQERKDHDILVKLCGATRHYAGHFHLSSVVDVEGCVSTILDELEVKEIV